MSKPRVRSPWLYGGVILLLLVLVGVYLFPPLSAALRTRQRPSSVAIAENASFPPPTATDPGELATRAKGYELVLQREPNNVTALQGLMEVRLEQGRLPEAMLPLERLVQVAPEQPDYGLLLGQARQHFGDTAGARQAYEAVLENHPGYIKALQSLVALQLEQNRPEWAIGLLQTTLKTAAQTNAAQPGAIDVASVQLLLGRVYEQQERYTEAIAVYDQVIAQNNNDFRPLWAKADLLLAQARAAAAVPLYNRALALAPPRYKDQIKQALTQAQTQQVTGGSEETEEGESALSVTPPDASAASAEATVQDRAAVGLEAVEMAVPPTTAD